MIRVFCGYQSGYVDGADSVMSSGTFTVGMVRSMNSKTSKVNVGKLCRQYGGGGHKRAGTCQPSIEDTERIFKEIIDACKD